MIVHVIIWSLFLVPLANSLACYRCSIIDCSYWQGASSNYIVCDPSVVSCVTIVHSSDAAERACLTDEKVQCADSLRCEKCDTDLCNVDYVYPGRCIKCDSTVDENCANNLVYQQWESFCPDATDGCYLYNTGDNQVRRGCVTDLSPADLVTCRAGLDCKICLGHNCNIKETFQKCIECNSTTDTDCVYKPPVEYSTVCAKYLATCISQAIFNGPTIRGCANEVDYIDIDAGISYYCADNNCNTDIVPYHRLQCHQCSSADPDCLAHQLADDPYLKPCRNYTNSKDYCYLYINEENEYYRGCLSDHDEGALRCEEDDGKCHKCWENGCNNIALLQRPSHYCVQCSETDPACAWGFPIGYGRICEKAMRFYEQEGCFTFKFHNGGVRRGCTSDEKEFCSENRHCEMCLMQECNRETKHPQYCIQCDSSLDDSDDPVCANRPRELEGAVCQPDPTLEEQGCFTYTDCDNVVHRGCVNALDARLAAKCRDPAYEKCEVCIGADNCNVKGSANRILTLACLPLFVVIWVSVLIIEL